MNFLFHYKTSFNTDNCNIFISGPYRLILCNFPRPTTQTMLAPHFVPQFCKVAFTLRHLSDGGAACALLQVTGTGTLERTFYSCLVIYENICSSPKNNFCRLS